MKTLLDAAILGSAIGFIFYAVVILGQMARDAREAERKRKDYK